MELSRWPSSNTSLIVNYTKSLWDMVEEAFGCHPFVPSCVNSENCPTLPQETRDVPVSLASGADYKSVEAELAAEGLRLANLHEFLLFIRCLNKRVLDEEERKAFAAQYVGITIGFFEETFCERGVCGKRMVALTTIASSGNRAFEPVVLRSIEVEKLDESYRYLAVPVVTERPFYGI